MLLSMLEYYFPNLSLTIMDMLPRCLGPLPDSAAEYCTEYMHASGINEYYSTPYEPKSDEFWKKIGLPDKADEIFVCIGVKASNYFVPKKYLSDKGPGGGGWIHMNEHLQVVAKDSDPDHGKVWGDGSIFAVGDCNYGCIGAPPNWIMHPIPKISYPGEEQALHALKSIEILDKNRKTGGSKGLYKTWWPWGAGMFATSLGPHDACFVMAANHVKGSGYMVNWWFLCALQKEFIETSKINECRNKCVGCMIWHFVHHTPVNLWGKGPWIS